MEYVQTVLAQVTATKAAEADGLISELEAHRPLASSQRGFRGMHITRTANPEGNVLVVDGGGSLHTALPRSRAGQPSRCLRVSTRIHAESAAVAPRALMWLWLSMNSNPLSITSPSPARRGLKRIASLAPSKLLWSVM